MFRTDLVSLVSPVREYNNPEVDGDKQGEDHVGESHPQAALQWRMNQLRIKEPWNTLRMVSTPLAMLMAMRSPARRR